MPPETALSAATRHAQKLYNRQRFRESCEAFAKVLARETPTGALHRMFGLALREAGHTDAALAQLKAAVVMDRDPASMDELAETLLRAGHLGDAEACLQAMLAQDREHAATWRRLGAIAAAGGRDHEAAALLREALARAPGDAHTLTLFGLVARRLGFWQASRAALLKARDSVADAHDALLQLADAMSSAELWDEAVTLYDRALARKPGSVAAIGNKAGALISLGRPRDALALLERADRLQPDCPPVVALLVAAWRNLGDLDRAEAFSRRALRLQPHSLMVRANAATLLLERGRFDETLAFIRDMAADFPGEPSVERFEALMLLLLGRFEEGWARLEARFRIGPTGRDLDAGAVTAAPRWAGEDLAGKRVLMTAEEGFGDTIQFVRYASLLAAQGARVGARVQPALRRLIEGARDVSDVHDEGSRPDGYDFDVPMLSLPMLLGTRLETIPAQVPYLHVPQDDIADWRTRLGGGLPHVGLVWAGNRLHRNDHNRSVPWQMFRGVAGVPGLAFHSLQVGEAQADMRADPCGVDDLAPSLIDYHETASAISAMDLVISVDTSVAHLAGALGKPVWLLLPLSPDWRWLLGRDDSPWYRTMRLFRQTQVGDWREVVARVEAALAAWTELQGEAPSPQSSIR